jgi:STE24 endopeptidase
MYGFWKNKRIVLYDNLRKSMNNDEISAVLYHELGHWKGNHTLKGICMSLFHIYSMLLVFWIVKGNTAVLRSFGCPYESVLYSSDVLKPNGISQNI